MPQAEALAKGGYISRFAPRGRTFLAAPPPTCMGLFPSAPNADDPATAMAGLFAAQFPKYVEHQREQQAKKYANWNKARKETAITPWVAPRGGKGKGGWVDYNKWDSSQYAPSGYGAARWGN